jgi:hypothetical protein
MRTIDFTNYFESTKVTYTCICEGYKAIFKLGEFKENSELEYHKSPKSCSQYFLDKKKGIVYRWSNHWGEVASCRWDLQGSEKEQIGGAMAMAYIKDFTENN